MLRHRRFAATAAALTLGAVATAVFGFVLRPPRTSRSIRARPPRAATAGSRSGYRTRATPRPPPNWRSSCRRTHRSARCRPCRCPVGRWRWRSGRSTRRCRCTAARSPRWYPRSPGRPVTEPPSPPAPSRSSPCPWGRCPRPTRWSSRRCRPTPTVPWCAGSTSRSPVARSRQLRHRCSPSPPLRRRHADGGAGRLARWGAVRRQRRRGRQRSGGRPRRRRTARRPRWAGARWAGLRPHPAFQRHGGDASPLRRHRIAGPPGDPRWACPLSASLPWISADWRVGVGKVGRVSGYRGEQGACVSCGRLPECCC